MVNKVLIHILTKTPIKNVNFLPFEYLPFFDGITHMNINGSNPLVITNYKKYVIHKLTGTCDGTDRQTIFFISDPLVITTYEEFVMYKL